MSQWKHELLNITFFVVLEIEPRALLMFDFLSHVLQPHYTIFSMLWIKFRTSNIVSKCSITEPYPQPLNVYIFASFYFIFVVLGFEFRASLLLGRRFATWATLPDWVLYAMGQLYLWMCWWTCLSIFALKGLHVARLLYCLPKCWCVTGHNSPPPCFFCEVEITLVKCYS
jgi:hypothetical protein